MAILGTCCMSLLIVSMDATIVNVALPAIRTDLNASVSSLQWVIDIYTLVLASLLMVSGATADRYGRKRLFQIGPGHVRDRIAGVQPGAERRGSHRRTRPAGRRWFDAQPRGDVDHHADLRRPA